MRTVWQEVGRGIQIEDDCICLNIGEEGTGKKGDAGENG